MKSTIKHSFFNQKAKQLKKEENLKLHQARDAIAVEYGLSNYKHYLNVLKSKKFQLEQEKSKLLQKIQLEQSVWKKTKLTILYLEKFNITFEEFYELIIQLKRTKMDFEDLEIFDVSLQLEAPTLFDSICKKFKLEEYVYKFLYHHAKSPDGYLDYQMEYEFYTFKSLSINNLTYEINGNDLHVEGDFEILCEFEHDFPEELKDEPHFQDKSWNGTFIISIDKNKKLELVDASAGEA